MKNKPEISVIVPVYNVEKYLDICLQSIINQAYSNFEIILINDGSTDNSLSICEDYAHKDNRIRIVCKENGGVSSARNKGLDEAKGEYICFVDADDWVDENYLQVFIDVMQSNIMSDLIISNIKMIKPKGIIYSAKFPKDELIAENFVPNDFMLVPNKLLLWGNFILTNSPWNKLYKYSIIKNNGIRFNDNIKLGEDFIFVLQYALCCKIIKFINEYTYNYNNCNQSATRKYISNSYFESKKLQDAYFAIIQRYMKITEEQKLHMSFRRASKAVYQEGNDINKNFMQRYKSIKSILKIDEVEEYIKRLSPEFCVNR